MPKLIRKISSITITLTVVAMLIGPSFPVKALTADELQAQIDALLAQLTALQDQLSDLNGDVVDAGTGVVPAACSGITFNTSLTVGSTGADVKCLQTLLNTDSDTKLADSGAGSPGNETSYFGSITKGGVIKFQEKYASEILASWGLTAGTGFVGSTTRAKLNSILEAGVGEQEEEEEEEEE